MLVRLLLQRDAALPDPLFPQTLEEANARHCETPFHRSLGPRPSNTIFHTHTHFRALSSATIGSLMCSSQSANLVSFLHPNVVFTRGVVVFFSCILGCHHFPECFCFLGLRWLLPTAPARFFVGVVQLSPVFSFDAFCTTPDRKACQSVCVFLTSCTSSHGLKRFFSTDGSCGRLVVLLTSCAPRISTFFTTISNCGNSKVFSEICTLKFSRAWVSWTIWASWPSTISMSEGGHAL